MRSVCRDEDMPGMETVFRWLRTNQEFREQYEISKAEAADFFTEDMLDIADDGTNDWMERLDREGVPAGYVLNGEHVQRSRLRIDTRKWLAMKLKPKKYGDSSTVTTHNVHEHHGLDALKEKQAALEAALAIRKARERA